MEKSEIGRLVALAKQGEEQAKGDLCRLTYDSGYFIAYKITKNQDDALDIVQDSYVKAFLNLERLEKEESFVSWFHCIVSNRAKDYVKKRKPTLFVEMRGPEDEAEVEFADEDITFRPDESLDDQETQRLVEEMVDSLPEDQRLCVLMYYYDELPVARIAQALELSENTVKSRLNYARKKIKKQVHELERRDGIKLYGAAPTPLLIWALRQQAAATALPAGMGEALVEQALSGSGAGAAAAVGGAAAGSTQAAATAAAAGKAVSLKTIAGIAAGVVAAAGVTAGVLLSRQEPEAVETLVSQVEETEREECEDEPMPEELSTVAGTFSYDFGGVSFELPAAWAGYVAFLESDEAAEHPAATAFYLPCSDIYQEDGDGRSLLFVLEEISREQYDHSEALEQGDGLAVSIGEESVVLYVGARHLAPEADRSGLSDTYWEIVRMADELFEAAAQDVPQGPPDH